MRHGHEEGADGHEQAADRDDLRPVQLGAKVAHEGDDQQVACGGDTKVHVSGPGDPNQEQNRKPSGKSKEPGNSAQSDGIKS